MKKWIIWLLAAIVVGASVFVIVFFEDSSLPEAVFVADQSWELVMPQTGIKALADAFKSKGIKLNKTYPDSFSITEQEALETFLSNLDGNKYIILCPVVSRSVAAFGVNASQITDAYVIGIGTDNKNGLFDLVLKSDFETGWEQIGQTDAIVMKDEAPTAATFRNGSGEEKYIVDYRYSQVVPAENLKGVISPDLVKSIIPYVESNQEKGTAATDILYYEYREI